MVKIHRLKQPNKRSGYRLESGKTTEVRGMVITNKNAFAVYVDKFTRKAPAKKVAKASAKTKSTKKAK